LSCYLPLTSLISPRLKLKSQHMPINASVVCNKSQLLVITVPIARNAILELSQENHVETLSTFALTTQPLLSLTKQSQHLKLEISSLPLLTMDRVYNSKSRVKLTRVDSSTSLTLTPLSRLIPIRSSSTCTTIEQILKARNSRCPILIQCSSPPARTIS
jgi:hypothetical protein